MSSETGRAAGIILTPASAESDEDEAESNASVNSGLPPITKLSVETLTVTARNGTNSYASDGVLLVSTKDGGSARLFVNGAATVTADNALRTVFWDVDGREAEGEITSSICVEDNASLKLNGSVSSYKGGLVVQKGATVELNAPDGKFFGGKLYLQGGSFESKVTYNSTGFESNPDAAPGLTVADSGSATLGGMTIGGLPVASQDGTTEYQTRVQLFCGSITVNGSLNIAENGRLGADSGLVTVNGGNSTVLGQIDNIITELGKESSARLHVKGGTLAFGDTAKVHMNGLWLSDGAKVSVAEKSQFNVEALYAIQNGIFDAPNTDFASNTNGCFYLMDDKAVVNLRNLTLNAPDESKAPAKVLAGELNVNSLTIEKGAWLGVNSGTINVTGGQSVINGSIGLTSADIIDNETGIVSSGDEETSSTAIFNVKGGEFALAKDSKLLVKTLNVTDGAQFENNGAITAQDALTVENATFTHSGSLYAKTLTLGDKAVWYSNEGEKFETMVFGAGSQYISPVDSDYESSDESDDDWADVGTMVLQGGALLEQTSGGTLRNITGVFAVGSEDEATKLKVEGGSYTFDGIRIGDGTKRTGELSVSGGTLAVTDTLSIEKGTFAVSAGTVKAGKLSVANSATAEISGGSVTASELALTGTLTVLGGALTTGTAQVFTEGLGEKGDALEAGELSANGKNITLSGTGVLVMNDAKYNFLYAQSAAALLNATYAKDDQKTFTLWFTGEVAEAKDAVVTPDKVPENTVHSNVTVEVKKPDNSTTATIEKTFGAKDITVAEGVTDVKVSADKTLTIVGSTESGNKVIAGKTVTKLDVGGNLALGQTGASDKGGVISVKVDVVKGGTVQVQDGKFTLNEMNVNGKVAVQKGDVLIGEMTLNKDASVEVNGGDVTVGKMQLADSTKLSLADAATTVKELVVKAADSVTHVITGALDVQKLTTEGNVKALIEVGTNDQTKKDDADANKKGTVKIGKDSSLTGLTFFLDPAWKDGSTVEDASSLILESTTVDAEIVVGQNSYVVLGSDSADAFLDVAKKSVTWGENGTTAAAYVAQPVTISGGALVVNGEYTEYSQVGTVAENSVVFAANSALVADVSNANGKAMITASSFDIAESAQAILTNVTSGSTYTLLAKADGSAVTSNFKNVKAANSMFSLDVNEEDGTIKARMNDAALIYGSAMQGTAIANAAMLAGNTYVNDLLSDSTDTVALSDIAARFDAAMNPAGALTTFTTAYDRASELRQIVRDETAAADGDNRLWVHVTGGKTKLKGISTGGQDLHTKTTAYGIIVGGEAALTDGKLGFALTAGTGDTKNHSVSAKDEFNYYGASVYGKTKAGSVDILADASATFVKSDLTVGDVADVDTDVTTSVYSFGVQGRTTFELAAADVTPFIGMDVYHVRGGSYSNGHGAHVQSSNATAVEFPVGAEVSKAFATASGLSVKPAFSLAVVPTVADRDIDSKVKMAGASSTYNFTFADDVKVRTKLGIEAQKENFTFGLQAGYEWGNEERSSANVEARLKYCF